MKPRHFIILIVYKLKELNILQYFRCFRPKAKTFLSAVSILKNTLKNSRRLRTFSKDFYSKTLFSNKD